ncbi:MAG: BamA/TamA family outer membrane protein [Desulfosarcinaceae bacterium]|nr:BamA/TamA family outer membrane protein [Desulfosarcinaceae bacterium]
MRRRPSLSRGWALLVLSFLLVVTVISRPADADPQDAQTLVALEVVLPEGTGDVPRWTRMVEDLSLLTVGEPITDDRLAEAHTALTLSQRFKEIVITTHADTLGSRVEIRVAPYDRVRKIRIRGHYPLFESEVRRALPIYAGDLYDPDQVPAVAAEVEALYREIGYIAPRVSIHTRGDGETGILLEVIIAKGTPRRLASLIFNGNRTFGDNSLKRKCSVWLNTLKPWPMPFSEVLFKKDVAKLRDFYRSRHFADVEIDYRIDTASTAEAVTATVNIVEGPRYAVEFEGNDHFWDLTLKKDLTLWKTGNGSGRGLRRSIRQITARYRRAGFQSIRITPRVTDTDRPGEGPIRQVRLIIEEGPRTQVQSVAITGNRAVSDGEIRGQLLTRPPGTFHWGAFDEAVFDEDLFSLSALYLQKGFESAEITPELSFSQDRTHLDIRLRIAEWDPVWVEKVVVQGSQVLDSATALEQVQLRPGEPFRRYMLKSDENILSGLVSEQGYPHVRVTARLHDSADASRVTVVYDIEDGPYVQLGRVYTDGYFKTRPRVLRKILKTESGAPFSLTQMVAAQRDLRDMEIFRQVRLKTLGLQEKRDTVHVVVDAEERAPYFVEAGGGYETDKGFYGRGRVGDHNLLGLNKSGWMSGEFSEIGYHGELGLTEPRLLGTQVEATVGAFVDREQNFNQDFGTHSFGTTLSLRYELSEHLSTGVGLRYESRDQFSRGAVIEPDEAEDFKPRNILVTTPGLRYDSRDDFIRPRSGVLGQFRVDISKGLTNQLDDFLKYELDLRTYLTPFPRLTFAWRGFAGHLDPYGANRDVPDDQLIFLGGTNDVRGFEENLLLRNTDGDAVGGRNALFVSLEARIDLGRNFELTSFYDLGSLQDEDNRSGDPIRSSVGLGLRYHTPIGPIGLLYGYKLSRESGEDPGRLHFSIGYTF